MLTLYASDYYKWFKAYIFGKLNYYINYSEVSSVGQYFINRLEKQKMLIDYLYAKKLTSLKKELLENCGIIFAIPKFQAFMYTNNRYFLNQIKIKKIR